MKKILKFYSENSFKAAVIATVLSRLISDLLYSFIDNIIYPIFKIDLDNDGKPDINSYINNYINIFGIKIKFYKFLIEFLKFIFLLYIIYHLLK